VNITTFKRDAKFSLNGYVTFFFNCGMEAMSKDGGQISIRSPIHMTFGGKRRTSFRNHESNYNFKIRGTVIVKYMTFFILYEIYRVDKICLFYGTFAGQFDSHSVAPPHCVFRFRSNSCDFWCW